MIAQLSGSVLQIAPTAAVIEVGGLGLQVLCSPNTSAQLRIGQRATLATTLIVREDSLTLYGFATAEEREFFDLLLTATGIGPKIAQAALAVLTPDELRRAIATENLVQLTKVPGIGRKGAERLVIELRDKIAAVGVGDDSVATTSGQAAANWRDQVAQGLQSLGYSAKDAESACVEVEPLLRDSPGITVAALLKAALQTLARR